MENKRPLLIGYMPSKPDAGPAMGGAIGRRLLGWAEIEFDAAVADPVAAYFDAVNLNKTKAPKFSYDEANTITEQITKSHTSVPWILCGREVAKIVGREKQPFWEWQDDTVVIPHPSGRCRVYNDYTARARTGKALREALEKSRG